jgi:hypothetical protein
MSTKECVDFGEDFGRISDVPAVGSVRSTDPTRGKCPQARIIFQNSIISAVAKMESLVPRLA